MSMNPGRYDGIPGLVWYSDVRKMRGDELEPGMWLDSLDHSGARMICSIDPDMPQDQNRMVRFSCGDGEEVRKDVQYDVVDPSSQVAPDGSRM